MIPLISPVMGLLMLSTPEQAWLSMQDQQWERAEQAYETVVAENPYRSSYYLNLGYARTI